TQPSRRWPRIDFSAEASRIRENMKAVGQSTPYCKQLLAKLDEQESSIENLQSESKAMPREVRCRME
ncbi:MAG: hypothetical protein M3Y64_10255, partial [Gemmatimonadota bacterium]|nr:hypothetical protein [Gemmatimonadota bacterium]